MAYSRLMSYGEFYFMSKLYDYLYKNSSYFKRTMDEVGVVVYSIDDREEDDREYEYIPLVYNDFAKDTAFLSDYITMAEEVTGDALPGELSFKKLVFSKIFARDYGEVLAFGIKPLYIKEGLLVSLVAGKYQFINEYREALDDVDMNSYHADLGYSEDILKYKKSLESFNGCLAKLYMLGDDLYLRVTKTSNEYEDFLVADISDDSIRLGITSFVNKITTLNLDVLYFYIEDYGVSRYKLVYYKNTSGTYGYCCGIW